MLALCIAQGNIYKAETIIIYRILIFVIIAYAVYIATQWFKIDDALLSIDKHICQSNTITMHEWM